jgi:O-antigen ligase
LVFLVLILFFIFPRAEKSLYALNEGGGYFRYLQIQDTLPIILKNPLFGVGTGMSVVEGLNFNPKGFYSRVPLAIHNWYLLLLAEHGIPGLLFFIMFLWLALRENLNLIWKEKMMADIQVVRLGFVAGALSLVIVGFFQPFLGEYLIFLAFAILGSSYYEKS